MTPYFAQDGVTLYHGDNVQTMRESIPDASIDLVVTSPPYDNLRSYGGHTWDFEGVAQQLWRVIKPGGVVVWVVNDATIDGSETGTSFRQALHFMEIGFRLHDTMIYEWIKPFPESNRYHPAFEYMFVLSNGKPTTFNCIKDRKNTYAGDEKTSRMERQPNGTNRRPEREYVVGEFASRFNIWKIPSGFSCSAEEKTAFNHPAIFPEPLARDHIMSWSNEGDTILDPFSGSGTTIKMARLMGRKGIGIEIHQEYCDIAVERLRQKLLF
ncbi:MAG: DNA-methyltransferase [Pseudomonadota bacterium]